MALNRYFQDELAYLREMGEEFSEIYPKLSRYLSDQSNDPDVERILESFAFLTARVRAKIEDELPELTHSVINLLWPNYLRYIPSMTIMEYTPKSGAITEKAVIEKGAEFHADPVEGTSAIFTSCYDVAIYPLQLKEPEMIRSRRASELILPLQTEKDVPVSTIKLDRLTLYLGGAPLVSHSLYLWLFRYLDKIEIRLPSKENSIFIDKQCLKRGGMDKEEEVIPFPKNSFEGYRILQEYFCMAEKFQFVHIDFPKHITDVITDSKMQVVFHFNRSFPQDVQLRHNNIRLFCSPAINLFKRDADPIQFDFRRTRYRLRISGKNPEHFQIFQVNKAIGWSNNDSQGGRKNLREYPAFESFEHEIERENFGRSIYHKVHIEPALDNEGLMHFISFVDRDDRLSVIGNETVSAEMLVCNGNLPHQLAPGGIQIASNMVPSWATYNNITKPSLSVPPPMSGSLHWLLISNMSLNYTSLTNKESLQTILNAYDFHAHFDRQAERAGQQRLDAILDIQSRRVDRLFKGLPIRGLQTNITIKESLFASEGDMYLFASALAEFFRLYASINSFHELIVHGVENGEVYKWDPMIGQKMLM